MILKGKLCEEGDLQILNLFDQDMCAVISVMSECLQPYGL